MTKTYIDDNGRICTKCQKYKEWEHFAISINLKYGHVSYCKPCYRDYDKGAYERKKQANPGPRMSKLYERRQPDRDIPTESWLNDKRTAKHEVEIKEGFELVEIGMKPFYGFYDKRNQ